MTSVEFLKLCVRRWYVLALGLAITAAVTLLATGPNTVYYTRTTVNVLAPDRGKVRIVGFHSADSIAIAHLLAARVNNGVHTPLASDPDATLYSLGIRRGTHAQVRNIGGQWLSQVEEPVVDVQVVDPDRSMVEKNLGEQVANLQAELTAVEKQLKVPDGENIELQMNPEHPVIHEIVTPRSRAQAGYGLGGLALSLWAAWAFDRAVASRRRHPAPVAIDREEQNA
ncbi:hypothetical protein AAEX63_11445 [Luteococcus sp. H138]|uniref:hypothetical protein n=1 Tax=unclassified Luteococcus TaxID=2639923 RepID=UPI00313E29DA